jgi:hypothetical protein
MNRRRVFQLEKDKDIVGAWRSGQSSGLLEHSNCTRHPTLVKNSVLSGRSARRQSAPHHAPLGDRQYQTILFHNAHTSSMYLTAGTFNC